MKKTVLMNAAKKARIALAVMAVCGMSFVGAQEAFAEIHISGNDNTYTDAKDFSTIVGNKNKLTGKDYDGEITKFTVLGSENSVNAFYEYVLSENLAKKNQITVVGTKNNIKGTRNTVVGDNNTVYFNESIVLGQNNSLNPWNLYMNSGKNILIGNDINAQTNDSNIAIGNKMTVTASWNTTIIGNESKSIGASEAVILGSNINAAYNRSVMVGNRTWAHSNSVALGYNAVAAVAGAEALGARSRAEKYYSVALGCGSLADEENTVSVGSNKERTITESNGTTTTIPTRYRRIVNMADGTNNHDAATFGQIIKKDIYTISLDDTGNGNVVLKTNADKEGPTIKVDASALDMQIKQNASDITAVNGKIGILSADGTYIKKANNVSANLVELDNQVNANATAITNKANLDLSNISTAGKDVIINLAGNKAGEIVDVKLGAITSTHYVSASGKVNANISALDTQLNKVENKIGTMTDGNYISAGNTVAGNLSALDNQLKANADAINTKADKDLSNITDAGKNVIKDLAGNKAGEIVDTKLGDITSENYVNKTNTVNANISALDKQVKANADAINTKADKDLSNITDAGKNVIKDLAGNKAGEVVDAKLGDITSENYVKKADTVNANISALDKQMKANADDIITANTKITNVDNKIGDLTKLKTTEKGNLVGAVNEVNKKADKNADAIKTVNGRVDELGGRVDTLGGAVSKLDTKVNKVGAGAAALAALHPMDFDPDNKLTFAAGVGNYRGANAAAIGAFYRPNEQVMFSIAGNMGNGENMVNAGVSFALDRPSQTPTTKAALVKTVAAQNEQIAALSETVAEQNEKIARLEAMVEKLVAKQNA